MLSLNDNQKCPLLKYKLVTNIQSISMIDEKQYVNVCGIVSSISNFTNTVNSRSGKVAVKRTFVLFDMESKINCTIWGKASTDFRVPDFNHKVTMIIRAQITAWRCKY